MQMISPNSDRRRRRRRRSAADFQGRRASGRRRFCLGSVAARSRRRSPRLSRRRAEWDKSVSIAGWKAFRSPRRRLSRNDASSTASSASSAASTASASSAPRLNASLEQKGIHVVVQVERQFAARSRLRGNGEWVSAKVKEAERRWVGYNSIDKNTKEVVFLFVVVVAVGCWCCFFYCCFVVVGYWYYHSCCIFYFTLMY